MLKDRGLICFNVPNPCNQTIQQQLMWEKEVKYEVLELPIEII